jgi:hypothetical protein
MILGLVLACHVSAQQNHGDSSRSVPDKRYHWKRYTSLKPALPSALSSSFLIPETAQTDQTDTATQPIVQPIVQPAVPLSPRSGTDTQSCRASDHDLWISYSVLIRIPYIGPADCDLTYHALTKDATAFITNWQCIEKDSNIQLYFNTPHGSFGGSINKALESRYPTVNSFNCPDS